MKKYVKREQKKYPYKKTRLSRTVNTYEKYIVLDSSGNELGRYRLKQTCYQEHGKDCKIVVT